MKRQRGMERGPLVVVFDATPSHWGFAAFSIQGEIRTARHGEVQTGHINESEAFAGRLARDYVRDAGCFGLVIVIRRQHSGAACACERIFTGTGFEQAGSGRHTCTDWNVADTLSRAEKSKEVTLDCGRLEATIKVARVASSKWADEPLDREMYAADVEPE